jgi:diguanylate cyclase (GGDEF)-like protein
MDTPAKRQQKVSLLYVEDDKATRDMVLLILKLNFPDLTIYFAEDGQSGLDHFMEHHPDIVITDILMPGMSGMQMTGAIRALDTEVRLIVLTSAKDTDFIIDGINKGVNYYVLKPIKIDKLVAAVKKCLEGIQVRRQFLQQEEELRIMAYHDTLTGLPNRQLFNELVNLALAQAHRHNHGRRLAILFLDLDRFKVINDTLGHSIGDSLLQAVAQRLRECCRRERDTVARRGGDEFIILLPELDTTQEAVNVARKIVDSFGQPFTVSGHELYISTCIGISIFPNDGADGETLIRNADMAMYCAKESGRNRYHLYNPVMDDQAAQRLEMESSLRKGLQKGEFFLNYQPEVNVKTGRLISMEALLRWRHPELGLIPPLQFIPVTEEIGMIDQLGKWVLHTACAQNKAWQDAGYASVRVAVNLSPSQFQSIRLQEMVEEILTDTGLDPHWLELEVTEGIMLQDVDTTINTLSRLSDLGVHISIDDFGTGYSSLSYLRKLPIHTLKIDQSFINDILANPDDAAIATAIITMAKSLRLNVIAEGVEAKEQMRFLYALNCSSMQGYYFGKPLSAGELSPILKNPPWHKMGQHDCMRH